MVSEDHKLATQTFYMFLIPLQMRNDNHKERQQAQLGVGGGSVVKTMVPRYLGRFKTVGRLRKYTNENYGKSTFLRVEDVN